MSVYREKSSIYEYLAAGTLSGAMYKFNMGLRGMTAGGIIGGVLGGIGGAASLLILNLSGTSMEEVRYWQYKWRANRDDAIAESFKVFLSIFFLICCVNYFTLTISWQPKKMNLHPNF